MQVNRHVFADALGRRRFADDLVDGLADSGVRAIFGMPAESLNPIINAIERDGRITLVGVRHEGTGSIMASAGAKLSGTLGVSMATAGPGATHLPLGSYDATADRAPLLALSGQVPAAQVGLDSFQEIDPVALLADASSYNRYIGSARQFGMVQRAIAEATIRRCAAHLACSSDVLAAPMEQPVSPMRQPPRAGSRSDKALLDAATHRLDTGPAAVLVGRTGEPVTGAVDVLAEKLAAPVFVLPEGSEYFRSTPGWPAVRVTEELEPQVREVLGAASTVLLVGEATAAVHRVLPADTVVQVAPGAAAADRRPAGWLRAHGPETEILTARFSGVEGVLHELASLIGSRRGRGGLMAEADRLPSAGPPPALWRALDEALPDDAVLALEPGRVLDRAFSWLASGRRTLTSSFGLRHAGYALPAAIGATFAGLDRPVVAVTTAAGLQDVIGDLLTIQRYRLRLTVVCLDSAGGPDIGRIAAGSGLRALQAADASGLATGLRDAMNGPATVLSAPAESVDAPAITARGPAAVEPATGTAGTVFAAALAELGVRSAYVRTSDVEDPLLGLLTTAGIDLHWVNNPESATMAASAVAKFSGRPAVAVARGEADLVLQLNGAYDAAYDHAPLIVLGVDQEGAVVDGCSLLTDAAHTVRLDGTAASTAETVRAVHQAVADSSVVYVEIASDALQSPVGEVQLPEPSAVESTVEPPPELLDQAAQMLHAARRPVVLAGRGGRGCPGSIGELADLLGAPVVTTMPGRGAIADEHPHFVGGVGSSGHQSAARAIKSCDVLLGLGLSQRGTSAFDLTGDFALIQVEKDLGRLAGARRADLALNGTSANTLQLLTEQIAAMGPPPSEVPQERAAFLAASRHEFAKAQRRAAPMPPTVRGRLRPSTVAKLVRHELLDRAGAAPIVPVDVGLVTLWIYRYLVGAVDFAWSSSFATMGFAVPAAVALAGHEPERPVLAFVGDGGVAVTLSELATVARLQSPVVIMVFNNGKLGAIKFEQEIMGWPEFGAELHNGDLAEIARGFGVPASTARSATELRRILHRLRGAEGPHLVDVVCEPHEIPALAQHRPAAAQVFAYGLARWREARRALRGGSSVAGGRR